MKAKRSTIFNFLNFKLLANTTILLHSKDAFYRRSFPTAGKFSATTDNI